MRSLIKSLSGLVLGAVTAPRGSARFGASHRYCRERFVVLLLLLAPFALAIRVPGRQALVQRTALAVAGLFSGSTLLTGLPAWPTTAAAALALVSPCAALVAGVWLSLKVIGRAPHNSSKSTPLRGTA